MVRTSSWFSRNVVSRISSCSRSIQRAVRGWLDDEGFVEVDPAALAVSPGNEAHLHGFATDAIGNDGVARRMHLHTSPEFAMKKLLAAGETRIAAFSHVWRNRERGPRHSPEFTMLEWYRTGEPYDVLIDDCAAFLRVAAEAAGATLLRHGDATCDPFAAPERLSVADAFARHAGFDLLATVAAAVAPGIGLLLVARAAQGLESAVMMPQILATIQAMLTGADRTLAVAVFSAVSGVPSE